MTRPLLRLAQAWFALTLLVPAVAMAATLAILLPSDVIDNAEPPPPAPRPLPSQIETIRQAVLKNRAWVAEAATCPAQLMPAHPAPVSKLDDSCFDTPTAACLAHCEQGSADACYYLARALGHQERDDADDTASETLFQRSCKLGHPSGCTNRAAGLTYHHPDDVPGNQCAARTFEKSCAQDDPWGCTMFGRHLARGLGVRRNPERALQVIRKSCKYGPDDAACSAAQDLRAEIARQKAKP